MILGACSLCGGSVEQWDHSPFCSSEACPKPTCICCGATVKCKVIEMEPKTYSAAEIYALNKEHQAALKDVTEKMFSQKNIKFGPGLSVWDSAPKLNSGEDKIHRTNVHLDDAEYLDKLGNG